MLSVTEISKASKLSRKTVYNVFRGTASLKSVSKVKKAIYKITKKVVESDELVKGKYSNNSLIKILCKNTEKAKKCRTSVVAYLGSVSSGTADSDSAGVALHNQDQYTVLL